MFVIGSALCGSGVLQIGPHHPLVVVEVRLNETTRLPCVATRNGGGRDPGGWNTPLWPLLHLDGRSNGLDSINRLVTSIPLTDPVNTVRVCSCCYLTEILGIQVSSVLTLRGGKEGMVGHSAWHLEFLRNLAEAAGQNRTTFLPQIIKRMDR
jgi:hypothetical protein